MRYYSLNIANNINKKVSKFKAVTVDGIEKLKLRLNNLYSSKIVY